MNGTKVKACIGAGAMGLVIAVHGMHEKHAHFENAGGAVIVAAWGAAASQSGTAIGGTAI